MQTRETDVTKKKPTDLQYLQNILIEKEALVQELRTLIDGLQECLSVEQSRSAKWERRFDRLLNALQQENVYSRSYAVKT